MMEYYCTITEESGLFGVEFPDLPSVITVGSTRDEALAMASDALNSALESDVSRGLSMPEPSIGGGPDLYPIEVAPHIVKTLERVAHALGKRLEVRIA
jgi:predicted RNase H-like HicB family nuclease